MDEHARHLKIWKLLYGTAGPWIRRRFRFSFEPILAEGPLLVVANHVTSWDPLLIALALNRKQAYFVASEHIARTGLAARILKWGAAPILRPKGAAAMETVRQCVKHLRAGHSVCLFAEGEASWDGRNVPVVSGTGTLARLTDATLVTYRLEGAYLSLPRWGRGLRRGRVTGSVAGIYSASELKGMSSEEVNALLDRDIRVNAWERQDKDPVSYRSPHPAEYLERLLYLCPGCHGISTLHSHGSMLDCSCGLRLRFTDTGMLSPASPFRTLAEWEDWQKEELLAGRFTLAGAEGLLFRDEGLSLTKIGTDHSQEVLGSGDLCLYRDRLVCAGRAFALDSIQESAMAQHNTLLFTGADGYYQIRCKGRVNLRKYLEIIRQNHQ